MPISVHCLPGTHKVACSGSRIFHKLGCFFLSLVLVSVSYIKLKIKFYLMGSGKLIDSA